MAPRIAVLPNDHFRRPHLVAAVEAGGGEVVDAATAQCIVWCDPAGAEQLRAALENAPEATWVQLPWAGVERLVAAFDTEHIWTCGKGVYDGPVAELALTLALSLRRGVGEYARLTRWSDERGESLVGANVAVLGGGAIAETFVRLIAPFDCDVTVLRRHPEPMDGVDHVTTLADLDAVLPSADVIVLALALTPETERVIGAPQLARCKPDAQLINVARGRHIDTDALVAALRAGQIGGAGLDVTDPEPLPDGHPLWSIPNCIITPHVGNTEAMARIVLGRRITENIRRFARGEPLLGLVNVELGY
ncbi:MAG: D-isomer specific 2-hydroxyacid dehydrogenase family protein [Acidimicrobiia bacterium]